MTEERRAQLYKAWDELSRRQLSNSENFGRAILSLSTAGLALSVAFMKEVVEIDKATDLDLLYWSWGAFAAAISTILFSYHTSQRGIKKQFAQIRNELKDKKDTKLGRQVDRLFRITNGLVYFSHLCFIVAIFFTVIFIQTEAGGMIMPSKKTQDTPLQDQVPKTKIIHQDSIEEKGAPKVEILPEPLPNTNIGSEASASNPNTNTGSDGAPSNTGSSSSSQESTQSADK